MDETGGGEVVGRDKAEFDPAYPFENNCYVALLNNPVIYIDPSGQAVFGEEGFLSRIINRSGPAIKRLGKCLATTYIDIAFLVQSLFIFDQFPGDRYGAVDDERRKIDAVIECAVKPSRKYRKGWPIRRKRRK